MQGMSGDHPALESWRLQSLAGVYGKEGGLAEAAAAFGRARGLIERTGGPWHDYSTLANNFGVALLGMKRFDLALRYLRIAQQVAAKSGGPVHPALALSFINIAEALIGLHRYPEAQAAAEEALRIFRVSGKSPFALGGALTLEGEALLAQ